MRAGQVFVVQSMYDRAQLQLDSNFGWRQLGTRYLEALRRRMAASLRLTTHAFAPDCFMHQILLRPCVSVCITLPSPSPVLHLSFLIFHSDFTLELHCLHFLLLLLLFFFHSTVLFPLQSRLSLSMAHALSRLLSVELSVRVASGSVLRSFDQYMDCTRILYINQPTHSGSIYMTSSILSTSTTNIIPPFSKYYTAQYAEDSVYGYTVKSCESTLQLVRNYNLRYSVKCSCSDWYTLQISNVSLPAALRCWERQSLYYTWAE